MFKFATLGIFAILLNLMITVALLYAGGSVVVSGIKVATNQCNVKLGIEPTLDGSWFCPKK